MSQRDFTIRQLGPLGDGLSGARGETIFIERAVPGDLVRAQVFRDKYGLLRGEIIQLKKASQSRRTPPCPHYSDCGNCTVQHIEPKTYQVWKERTVYEALARQSLYPTRRLKSFFVEAGKRRRATFTAVKTRDRNVLGYYKRRSQRVSAISSCLVIDPELELIRDRLEDSIFVALSVDKPVDIFVQKVGSQIEVVLTGPVRDRASKLKEVIEYWGLGLDLVQVSVRQNYASRPMPVFRRGPLTAQFGELKVTLPPASFLQPTQFGEDVLVQAVCDAVPDSGKIADLFSGCGTFSGPLLKKGPVDAFDVSQLATQALAKAGKGLSLNVSHRDLFTNPLSSKELNAYGALVIDPPKAGASAQATQISKSDVPCVVSVSCNPATFVRDAAILTKGGFRFESIQIVDQFLWSHSVEVVGVFRR